MGAKVVLVEDDRRLSSLISTFLELESFDLTALFTGQGAVEKIKEINPELLILDLMLPGMNGIEICQKLRPEFSNPILMLTAKEDEFTEILALNKGVDDYLTKPLRPHVLLARMNVLLRRQRKEYAKPNVIEIHDFVINVKDRHVLKGDDPILLTDAEFELFITLVKNAGTIVSRDTLFSSLRGIEYNGMDRAVDQRVSTLRKKLDGNEKNNQYIKTVRGQGYLFPKDAV